MEVFTLKLIFTDEEIKNGENIAELEDIIFTCEYIEVSEEKYKAFGQAKIDGEIYKEFQLEFQLEKSVESNNCSEIFNSDWAEYDYIFNV